jgi:hypothetical protein
MRVDTLPPFRSRALDSTQRIPLVPESSIEHSIIHLAKRLILYLVNPIDLKRFWHLLPLRRIMISSPARPGCSPREARTGSIFRSELGASQHRRSSPAVLLWRWRSKRY